MAEAAPLAAEPATAPQKSIYFQAPKSLWRHRTSLDIKLVRHEEYEIIELIGYCGDLKMEAPRVYFNFSQIKEKVADKIEKVVDRQREQLLRRRATATEIEVELGKDREKAIRDMVSHYIISRVDIDGAARRFKLKINVCFGDEVKGEDSEELDVLVSDVPKTLRPYNLNETSSGTSLENTISGSGASKGVTVDGDAKLRQRPRERLRRQDMPTASGTVTGERGVGGSHSSHIPSTAANHVGAVGGRERGNSQRKSASARISGSGSAMTRAERQAAARRRQQEESEKELKRRRASMDAVEAFRNVFAGKFFFERGVKSDAKKRWLAAGRKVITQNEVEKASGRLFANGMFGKECEEGEGENEEENIPRYLRARGDGRERVRDRGGGGGGGGSSRASTAVGSQRESGYVSAGAGSGTGAGLSGGGGSGFSNRRAPEEYASDQSDAASVSSRRSTQGITAAPLRTSASSIPDSKSRAAGGGSIVRKGKKGGGGSTATAVAGGDGWEEEVRSSRLRSEHRDSTASSGVTDLSTSTVGIDALQLNNDTGEGAHYQQPFAASTFPTCNREQQHLHHQHYQQQQQLHGEKNDALSTSYLGNRPGSAVQLSSLRPRSRSDASATAASAVSASGGVDVGVAELTFRASHLAPLHASSPAAAGPSSSGSRNNLPAGNSNFNGHDSVEHSAKEPLRLDSAALQQLATASSPSGSTSHQSFSPTSPSLAPSCSSSSLSPAQQQAPTAASGGGRLKAPLSVSSSSTSTSTKNGSPAKLGIALSLPSGSGSPPDKTPPSRSTPHYATAPTPTAVRKKHHNSHRDATLPPLSHAAATAAYAPSSAAAAASPVEGSALGQERGTAADGAREETVISLIASPATAPSVARPSGAAMPLKRLSSTKGAKTSSSSLRKHKESANHRINKAGTPKHSGGGDSPAVVDPCTAASVGATSAPLPYYMSPPPPRPPNTFSPDQLLHKQQQLQQQLQQQEQQQQLSERDQRKDELSQPSRQLDLRVQVAAAHSGSSSSDQAERADTVGDELHVTGTLRQFKRLGFANNPSTPTSATGSDSALRGLDILGASGYFSDQSDQCSVQTSMTMRSDLTTDTYHTARIDFLTEVSRLYQIDAGGKGSAGGGGGGASRRGSGSSVQSGRGGVGKEKGSSGKGDIEPAPLFDIEDDESSLPSYARSTLKSKIAKSTNLIALSRSRENTVESRSRRGSRDDSVAERRWNKMEDDDSSYRTVGDMLPEKRAPGDPMPVLPISEMLAGGGFGGSVSRSLSTSASFSSKKINNANKNSNTSSNNKNNGASNSSQNDRRNNAEEGLSPDAVVALAAAAAALYAGYDSGSSSVVDLGNDVIGEGGGGSGVYHIHGHGGHDNGYGNGYGSGFSVGSRVRRNSRTAVRSRRNSFDLDCDSVAEVEHEQEEEEEERDELEEECAAGKDGREGEKEKGAKATEKRKAPRKSNHPRAQEEGKASSGPRRIGHASSDASDGEQSETSTGRKAMKSRARTALCTDNSSSSSKKNSRPATTTATVADTVETCNSSLRPLAGGAQQRVRRNSMHAVRLPATDRSPSPLAAAPADGTAGAGDIADNSGARAHAHSRDRAVAGARPSSAAATADSSAGSSAGSCPTSGTAQQSRSRQPRTRLPSAVQGGGTQRRVTYEDRPTSALLPSMKTHAHNDSNRDDHSRRTTKDALTSSGLNSTSNNNNKNNNSSRSTDAREDPCCFVTASDGEPPRAASAAARQRANVRANNKPNSANNNINTRVRLQPVANGDNVSAKNRGSNSRNSSTANASSSTPVRGGTSITYSSSGSRSTSTDTTGRWDGGARRVSQGDITEASMGDDSSNGDSNANPDACKSSTAASGSGSTSVSRDVLDATEFSHSCGGLSPEHQQCKGTGKGKSKVKAECAVDVVSVLLENMKRIEEELDWCNSGSQSMSWSMSGSDSGSGSAKKAPVTAAGATDVESAAAVPARVPTAKGRGILSTRHSNNINNNNNQSSSSSNNNNNTTTTTTVNNSNNSNNMSSKNTKGISSSSSGLSGAAVSQVGAGAKKSNLRDLRAQEEEEEEEDDDLDDNFDGDDDGDDDDFYYDDEDDYYSDEEEEEVKGNKREEKKEDPSKMDRKYPVVTTTTSTTQKTAQKTTPAAATGTVSTKRGVIPRPSSRSSLDRLLDGHSLSLGSASSSMKFAGGVATYDWSN